MLYFIYLHVFNHEPRIHLQYLLLILSYYCSLHKLSNITYSNIFLSFHTTWNMKFKKKKNTVYGILTLQISSFTFFIFVFSLSFYYTMLLNIYIIQTLNLLR